MNIKITGPESGALRLLIHWARLHRAKVEAEGSFMITPEEWEHVDSFYERLATNERNLPDADEDEDADADEDEEL